MSAGDIEKGVSGRRGEGAGVEFPESVLIDRGVRGVLALDLFGDGIGISMLVSASSKILIWVLRFLF
jgi:hypothetical protein